MQRMLPAPASAPPPTSVPRPPPDNRQFQYRFSMTYIRSLPEGQRPVERELFGQSFQYRWIWPEADNQAHSLYWHSRDGRLPELSVQIARISNSAKLVTSLLLGDRGTR